MFHITAGSIILMIAILLSVSAVVGLVIGIVVRSARTSRRPTGSDPSGWEESVLRQAQSRPKRS